LRAPQRMTLESLINVSPLSLPQFTVIGLCALVAMVDGFDTQCIGLVAPEIAVAWNVSVAQFGLVFGAGLFGGLLGGMAFGAIADRLGRKPALLLAVCIFSAMTLLTPVCTAMTQLTTVRLLTGVGLGGALPAIISLTSEYAPYRLRATLVAVMFCGFPLGAALGGLITARVMPVYGWTSVFYLGGGAPLLLLLPLSLFLPESARFLAHRKPDRLERLLRKLGWEERWNGESGSVANSVRGSVRGLFSDGLASRTVLLWATLFCSLLLSYFLINWMPVLARHAGIQIQGAVIAVTMLNFGGLLGCLTIGQLSDRFGATRVVGLAFVIGGVAVTCLGLNGGSSVQMVCTAFLAGFFSIGGQMCTVALVPTFYNTGLRATGVGWSMAAGRFGAISGPIVGGALLAAGLSASILFLIVGGVSLVAAMAMLTLGTIKPVTQPHGGSLDNTVT
jgi:MFS transporter, AAHS family, 4-hydroxybenzoate transporter